MLIFTCRKSNVFRGPLRSYFGWNRNMIRRILINAAPTTANELMWSLGQTMYVAAFARIGTTAYAAYQAAAAINSLFVFSAFSIGDATLVMVGEKLGEGKKEETYFLAKKLLKVGVVFGVCVGLLLIALAQPLVGLFNLSALGKGYAFRILLIYGLFMGLNVHNGMQVTGTLRGGGDTKYAMIVESCSVWLWAVPLAFIGALVLHLPIYLAVLMLKTEDLVKAGFLLRRFFSKKWMNNIIEGL